MGRAVHTMNEFWNSVDDEKRYYYDGNDLGCTYTSQSTKLKVWAPTASMVVVNLYRNGNDGESYATEIMKKEESGIWSVCLNGDFEGVYYTYLVTVDGQTKEAVDPYARTTGLNGKRGMIIDLEKTNPIGFLEETKPKFESFTDAIIYEAHIRDISMESDSGIKEKGKLLGFTEHNTRNSDGLTTGLSHILDLGVTHIHLLPCFDYASVDEKDSSIFNWGYDPENYNVVEGSYSTNPYDGAVRVKEFKTLVQTLHKNGLRVIMDVAYNHTMETEESNFNKIVPNYYYRKVGEKFSDASACGNETASERLMVRKFIVDSIIYWAKEYHMDGFRFDLMGIHDIETMNEVRTALDQIDPSIILYGEGWVGGDCPLPVNQRAMKANMSMMPGIAAFSDDFRDGLKGSVFLAEEKGFATGDSDKKESVKFGVVAATSHPQVNYKKVNYSDSPWALEPAQCINYVSAHDNYTLWDKIACSCKEDSYEVRVKKNKLCAAIVFTSQGIPFLQAGEEMLRSKPSTEVAGEFVENSYNSSDSVNCIKWSNKVNVIDVETYYEGLIRFRKEHKALRMQSAKEISKRLVFLPEEREDVISYFIQGDLDDKTLCIIHNSSEGKVTITLPESDWIVYIDGNKSGVEPLYEVKGNTVEVDPISCMVLVKDNIKA